MARERLYKMRFLSFEGGINIASRYLAIVLLATLMPFSFKRSAILLSLNGLEGFSLPMSSLMKALMAVEEHSPPPSVDT